MDTANETAIGPIGRLLGIRPGEVGTVRRLFLLAFLLGLGLALFRAAANAIFLTRYDIGALPWVYIVNAIAVVVVGAAYGARSKRSSAAEALSEVNAVMVLVVVGIWVWALAADGRVVAFVLAVWFRILFIYAVLGLWEIAATVFDVRQAKRLFAAVALGMMVAFVVGGALTPLLGSVFGVINLVGLAALFLAAYTARLTVVLRAGGIGEASSLPAAPAGVRDVVADRTSRLMSCMRWVTVLFVYAAEFVFYEQAAATYTDEESLAGFLGAFLGASTLVMVLVTGLVSGRYISRHGVRVALLTLPIGMFLTATFAGLYGTLVATDGVFFAFVCVVLLTNNVLDHGIAKPAGAVLYQPMDPTRRIRVRLAIDGWMGSLALAMSGVLLLLLDALDLSSVAPVLFLVVAFAVFGVVLAVRQYDDYVNALRRATSLAFSSLGAGPTPPIDGVGAVLARPVEQNLIAPMAVDLLDHDEDDIAILALESIGTVGDRGATGAVARVVDDHGRSDDLRRRALVVLAGLDTAGALDRLDTDTERFADVAPVVLAHDRARRVEAAVALDHLASSPRIDDRLAACRLLDPDHELLIGLLDDPSADVVDAALEQVGGVVDEHVVETLVDLAVDPRHRHRAVRALREVGGPVPDTIRRRRDEVSPSILADLTSVLAAHHPGAAEFAAELLDDPTTALVVREACLRLASGHEVRPDRSDWLLDDDLDRPHRLAAAHAAIVDDHPGLALALEDDIDLSRRLVTTALAVDGDRQRFDDIALLLRRGDDDDRANAIEALDVTLTDPRRRTIIEVLEPATIDELAGELDGDPVDVLDRLADDETLSIWTRHLARRARADSDHDGDDTDEEAGVTDVPLSYLPSDIDAVLMLKRIEVFSTLDIDALAELADATRRKEYTAGATIFEQGALGEELFAVIEGTVEVSIDGRPVRQQGADSVFGELAMIDPAPRSATVVAVTDVDALVVSRQVLIALTERRPEVMQKIAQVLARRLRG